MSAPVCSWQTVLKWAKAMAVHPERRKAAAAVEGVLRCVDRRQIRNWRVAAEVHEAVKAENNYRFEHFTPSHALELARLAPRSQWAEWIAEVEDNTLTVKELREAVQVRKTEPKRRPRQSRPNGRASWKIAQGDCLRKMRDLRTGCCDAAIFSPPYPGIARPYGTWKPNEWLAWMQKVMRELRRIVKPTGSAVVVIQPNNERMGRRSTWPWRFALAMAEMWGIVQDAYWIKPIAFPTSDATQHDLMRTAVAWCLWLGDPGCYRSQASVSWDYGEGTLRDMARRAYLDDDVEYLPHGGSRRNRRMREDTGGATPMNCLVCTPQGYDDHPACFPVKLAQFWVRYVVPEGGTVVDPFCGSGTTGVACITEGRSFVGIERQASYVGQARRRLRQVVTADEPTSAATRTTV